jgi:hypothetical protein
VSRSKSQCSGWDRTKETEARGRTCNKRESDDLGVGLNVGEGREAIRVKAGTATVDDVYGPFLVSLNESHAGDEKGGGWLHSPKESGDCDDPTQEILSISYSEEEGQHDFTHLRHQG